MSERIAFKNPIDLLEPYRQQRTWSCGPASLVMVYHCFGVKYTEQQIIDYMGIEEHGMDWQIMTEFVQDSGMNLTFQSNANVKDMQVFYYQHYAPIIVAWNPTLKENEDHFSVIKRPRGDMLVIADPSEGSFVCVSESKFLKRWYGAGKERAFLGIYK